MIVLLNLISGLIVVGGGYLSCKLKKIWPICVALLFMLLYNIVQPSYLPKGEIKRSQIPEFEKTEEVIQDRNLSPKSSEQYDEDMKNMIQEGLSFKEEK